MDPRTYTAGEVLKDGTAVTIRAIQRGDKSRLLEAFKNLDRELVYRRFFSPKKELSDRELEQLTDVDFSQVVALVVTTQGADGEILIGGGRYATEGAGSGRSRNRLHDRRQLSETWHCVAYPEASRAHRQGGRSTAFRRRGARRKLPHACRLPPERVAHADASVTAAPFTLRFHSEAERRERSDVR